MKSYNWSSFYLRDNPFLIMPPADKEHLVWAGLPKLKREIEQKLIAAKQSSATQVILNRGPFGGGKTHAMRYYSFQDHLPKVHGGVRHVYMCTVITPKNAGKPANDFYIDILERIGMDQIKEAIWSAIQEFGKQNALEKLKEITGSDSLSQAIYLFGESGNGESDEGATSDAAEYNRLLEQYFLEGCTKLDLKKLGLARNINKDQDRFRVLAAFLHCFIGLTPGREITKHSRFCLWVDEMEDFVYFTTAQYRPFTQGLRDLIDRLPAFFSIWLNFTLTDPEEFETLEIIMGKALIDRVTDNIFFPEMTVPEAFEYVAELLSFWRSDDFDPKKESPYYPFNPHALEFIIENLQRRTPRSINKACSKILERALTITKGKSVSTQDEGITLEFVKSTLSMELENEFQ